MASTSRATFVLVLVALTLVQMGFGAYGVVVTKFAKGNNVDPLVFSLYRDGFCFPVLFLAAYVAEKKVFCPSFRELPLFITMGFLGMFANQLMYILGVYYTSADIASMLQPIAPVWTVIVAVIARLERFPTITTKIGASKVFGILIAVAGAVLMNFGKSAKHKSSNESVSDGLSIFGYCSLLINTLAVAIYVVVQKKYIFSVPTSRWRSYPIGITAWSYLFGFVSMAFASLYYVNQPEKFHLQANGVVYTLIYAVFIASAMCYMLITWCNMLVSTTLVAASWPLQVFFCVVLSYFILGETLSVIETVGGLLIIFSMLAVVWSNYQTELQNARDSTDAKLKTRDESYDKLIS